MADRPDQMILDNHVATADINPTVSDRRRPHRSNIAPQLYSLLRDPTSVEIISEGNAKYGEDDMSSAKGLALASLIMIPFWSILAACIW